MNSTVMAAYGAGAGLLSFVMGSTAGLVRLPGGATAEMAYLVIVFLGLPAISVLLLAVAVLRARQASTTRRWLLVLLAVTGGGTLAMMLAGIVIEHRLGSQDDLAITASTLGYLGVMIYPLFGCVVAVVVAMRERPPA